MNMHCASRLGWIRSSKAASPHAPEEVTDPAQAGSAASGRAPAGARAAASTRIRRQWPQAGAAFCFLAAALLLALPATVGAQMRGALVLSQTSVEIDDEDLGTAPYTVRLNTQPASEVTVVVATGDEDIALVSTEQSGTFTTSVTLTFGPERPEDWGVMSVFVRGVDDAVDNPGGSRVVEITHTPSGGNYRTGDAKTLQAWVLDDNDAVGWTFVESSGTRNDNQVEIDDEDGGTVTYTVELSSEPTSDVTVTVESDDPSAATVSPTSLIFSPDATKSNAWRTVQTITVTGVNDNVDNPPVDGTNDGRLARITHTPNGGGYDYIEPYSIEVTVMDNDGGDDEIPDTEDLVGLTLTPSTTGSDDEPLEVDEDGGRATYTVRLNTMPTATVTVFAESEDSSTATVSPLVLTFTRANWKQPQTVTVNGVNDDEDNENDTRSVRITYASSGGDYDGVDYDDDADVPATTAWSVMVSVVDDDTAGLRLSSDFVRLDENGTKTYTVRLETKPTANVDVVLESRDEAVATVMPETLTFSFANPSADNFWNKPQRVTVSAVADEVDNPNNHRTTEIIHTTSGDGKYEVSTKPELLVTVRDDADTAALLISESAITVTEAIAGNRGTYTVKLNSAPPPDGGTVTVTLVLSGDTGLIGVVPTSLEFTGRQSATDNGDWDDPKPVTVMATPDDVDTPGDARVTIKHSVSGEGGYNDVDPIDVQVTVKDDDVSELEVRRSLSVSEDGGPGSYTVSLRSNPGVTVSVSLTTDDDDKIIQDLAPTDLTFTSTNPTADNYWSNEQTVTFAGMDDEIDNPDDARSVIITHTIRTIPPGGIPEDPNRPDVDRNAGVRLFVTVRDDADTKGLIVDNDLDTGGIQRGQITVTEKDDNSGMATISVKLRSQPEDGNVTVAVISTDPQVASVTVNPPAATLSGTDAGLTITITGVDDDIYNQGRRPVRITLTPSGGGYSRTEAVDVLVAVTDDEERAQLTVTPTSITMPEDSTTEYTVRLNTEPTGRVTVNVASSNADAAKVRPGRPDMVPAVLRERGTAELTFTPETWEDPQTVTVVSVNDNVAGNDRSVTISNSASGGGFSGSVPVRVEITDDDTHTAELVIEPTALTVAEGDGNAAEATYSVKLSRAPIRDVEVRVSSEDATVATVIVPGSQRLEFTPGNWDTAQTVTVASVDDAVDNAGGSRATTISNTPSGAGYGEADARSIDITVEDDEGLVFSPASIQVGEAGRTNSYTVRLNTQPQGAVQVAVASSNVSTATVSPTMLGFTAANWDTPQTVTVTGVDDSVDNAGDSRSMNITHTLSGDGYGAGEAPTVQVTVSDDNDPEATLSISGGASVAEGNTGDKNALTFVVTKSGSTGKRVTVQYAATAASTAGAGDYQPATASGTLSFAPGATTQTITVTITGDYTPEPDETIIIELSNAVNGMITTATATGTITDDDVALGLLPDVTVTEGEEAPIRLMLDGPATAPVVLSYEIVDVSATMGEDYTILGPDGMTPLPTRGMVTIPQGFQELMVTVRTDDDSLAEGDETFRVVVGIGGTRREATATITDNDQLSASVTAPETVAEGETAPFTVTLRGGESTAPVVVTYTVGGTAKAPGDYTAPSGSLTIRSGESSGTIPIQTNTDNEIEPDETLVVTLTDAQTANGTAGVGSPSSATTAIQDPVFHSFNRVNQTLLPGVVRASAASALEAVSWRMAEAAQGDPPASADLAGLTGLYRALLANERALQDGSYDLAKVLGGSSFLVPLSSHDGDSGSQVGVAVWGGGDFRTIGGGDADTVDWDGSVWNARLGADMRFVDSLLTGIAVSWASGALDYVDATPRDDREGTYATWLVSAHPYVGWTTPDFGLWASGGFGYGGVTLDDSEEDAQEADLTQWSVGAGGSVTLLSTDWFIAGGTTAVKLKAEGFLAGATVAENESKVIQELTVGVNQARAAIEASHAQHFAGGGSLRPSLEIGGRFDGGDGETGAGMEVGGGLTYADPASGLTVAATGRALVVRDGDYSEWGVSGLFQWDPNAAGHGLMMSVRPTFGVTASGVSGLWEHGTLDLLSSGEAAGGRVEAEIGYGLAAFGTAGVLTPYAGASLTHAGAHSLSLGGHLELGPAFDLTLELERSDSADPDTAAEHDITLEGTFSW